MGTTKPIIFSMATASTLNAVLDPLMIYGLAGLPAMGVKGAAASVIAIVCLMLALEGC
ncbi:MAG: hypothetical protein ABWW69_02400 [Pyrodictiaceae archaeon]